MRHKIGLMHTQLDANRLASLRSCLNAIPEKQKIELSALADPAPCFDPSPAEVEAHCYGWNDFHDWRQEWNSSGRL